MRTVSVRLAICALLLGGILSVDGCHCGAGKTPEDELVQGLRDSPVLTVSGTSAGSLGGVSEARRRADEAKQQGVDLLALYKQYATDWPIRHQLALLMLSVGDRAYIRYAQEHEDELTEGDEFTVWVFLVRSSTTVVGEHFKTQLCDVLADVDVREARFAAVNRYLREHETGRAVEVILSVFADGLGEPAKAHMPFEALVEEPDRTRLLQSYLDGESAYGAYAAVVLSRNPEQHEKAIAYLEKLKGSRHQDLAQLASRLLEIAENEE